MGTVGFEVGHSNSRVTGMTQDFHQNYLSLAQKCFSKISNRAAHQAWER
jgi:hypothetical protein